MIKVMQSSVLEAVKNAISAVDSGDYKKTINLISYIERCMPEYDPVFINYMYLITYQNLGDDKNARTALDKLKMLKVDNPQMIDVINAISLELDKSSVEVVQVGIVEATILDLFASQSDLDFYASEFEFYRPLQLLKTGRSLEDEKEVLKLIQAGNLFYKDFTRAIKTLDHHQKPSEDHNLWVILKACKDNMFFWSQFLEKDFEHVLKDEMIDKFYKSFIISAIMKLRFLPCIKWPDFSAFGYVDEFHEQLVDDINLIVDDLNGLYDTGEDDDYDIVYSIVEIIIVDIFPKPFHEAFEYKKLIALVGYLYNLLIVGVEFDPDIYKVTKIKKVNLQKELDYYFELITFLIS